MMQNTDTNIPVEAFNDEELSEFTEELLEATEYDNDSEQKQEEISYLESTVEEKTERLTKLPLARIKHIMKMDPEVSLSSKEAVFLISKSTELFIQILAKEAVAFTVQGKKKTIQKKDVESAVSNIECLAFLEGALDF